MQAPRKGRGDGGRLLDAEAVGSSCYRAAVGLQAALLVLSVLMPVLVVLVRLHQQESFTTSSHSPV